MTKRPGLVIIAFKMEFLSAIIFVNFLAHNAIEKLIQIGNVTYNNGDSKWYSTLKKRPIEVFLGIPYAVPPVGNLRFTLPQKIIPNGQNYYVGTNSSRNPFTYSTCSQFDYIDKIVIGHKNCLHLNVYVPQTGRS